MTMFYLFAALSVACIVYTVVDDCRMDTQRQIEDFFRMEDKKAYIPQNGWN